MHINFGDRILITSNIFTTIAFIIVIVMTTRWVLKKKTKLSILLLVALFLFSIYVTSQPVLDYTYKDYQTVTGEVYKISELKTSRYGRRYFKIYLRDDEGNTYRLDYLKTKNEYLNIDETYEFTYGKRTKTIIEVYKTS